MLKELIDNGFGNEEDFNCAEKIIYGANIAYDLGLSKDSCRMMSSFGGGMGVEHLCGAIASGIAVLGILFVEDRGHATPRIKELTEEFIRRYQEEMGSIICADLKRDYRTEELKCQLVISKAAEILDDIIKKEKEA